MTATNVTAEDIRAAARTIAALRRSGDSLARRNLSNTGRQGDCGAEPAEGVASPIRS